MYRTLYHGGLSGMEILSVHHVVFDASQQTPSGTSLNDILTKGKNNINKVVETVIRWSKHRIGFHTDMKKIFTVQLRQEDWCLQRYIWQKD